MPTSIVLVSCLGDFYGKVREVLAQSYIDRIEKAGPVRLEETRTADEARLIIAKRLQQDGAAAQPAIPAVYFGPQFFEEFSGLSTRRILELAQTRMREREGDAAPEPAEKRRASSRRWPRRWASAVAERADEARGRPEHRVPRPVAALHRRSRRRRSRRRRWRLLDVLAGALALAQGGVERRRRPRHQALRRLPRTCRPST